MPRSLMIPVTALSIAFASHPGFCNEPSKTKAVAENDPNPCLIQPSPSDKIGVFPSFERVSTGQLSASQAYSKIHFDFPVGAVLKISRLPSTFALGSAVPSSGQEQSLRDLAHDRDSLQICKLTFSQTGKQNGDEVVLSDLKTRYRGGFSTGEVYSVTLNGQAYERVKNAGATLMIGPAAHPSGQPPTQAAFSINIQCSNYKGEEPLTYQTIQDALGVPFLPTFSSQALECVSAPQVPQAAIDSLKAVQPASTPLGAARETPIVSSDTVKPQSTIPSDAANPTQLTGAPEQGAAVSHGSQVAHSSSGK